MYSSIPGNSRIVSYCLLIGLLLGSSQIFAQRDANQSIKYLQDKTTALNVSKADLQGLRVDHVTKGSSGFEVAYLQQTANGITIHNQIINVIYDSNGEVVGHSGKLSNNIDGPLVLKSPGITPRVGLSSAAAHLGLSQSEENSVLEPGIGSEQKGILSKGSIAQQDITFRLVYVDMGGKEGLRLCWEYVIYENSSVHWWQIRVDAATGEVLGKNDWVSNCKVDHTIGMGRGHIHGAACAEDVDYAPLIPNSYNVYAMPVESPNHGGRTHETMPWLASSASPFGWHDDDGAAGAEYTFTRGNNVYATEDQDNNNTPGFAPDGGANLDFDYPIDFANTPDTYAAAAITNLFYWNNILHDVLWEYGFDEPSGNFQENNYGNGGLGSDYVNADALDGSGTNNANFATPPDGSNPRMQMYVWNCCTTPAVTSDLDNGIIAHEYGHGWSIRLTGGPQTSGCLTGSEQMGEGWSDYLSLIFTMRPGDEGTTNRGVGTYVLGEPTTGTGIRQYPYNTDITVNQHTYGDIGGLSVPHGVGSVWAMMLWEMTWDLIAQYGWDPDIYNGTGGNNIALQLVTDGLKLQPCGPGFVDGRDAILLADQINNGGANQCLIWTAFAKRGLGISADQGSSGSSTDGTEAFDTPCFCDPTPPPTGCTDPVACNFDPTATCDDLSCTYPGCTNPAACNYDPDAGCDDGSCLVVAATPTLTILTDCWPGETSWDVVDGLGNIVALSPGGYAPQTQYDHELCLTPGQCYTFNIYDSYGDGLNGTAFGCAIDGDYYLTDDDGTVLFQMGLPDFDFGTSHAFCPGLGSLQIDKTGPDTVLAGTNMTYTVTVDNTTAADVTNVEVVDVIPPEVSYVPGSASCTASILGSTLTLDLGTIPAGGQVICTYEVSVPSSPFTVSILSDDMESGAGSFTVTTALGASSWSQVTTDANSPVTSWFAEDPDSQSDQYLDLPLGTLTSTSHIRFWHNYITEEDWDGGVIEISTDGGTNWTDLGPMIIQNGYDGPVQVNAASPISGRPAFHGNSGGWKETIVDLTSFDGQAAIMRWRMACDAFVGGVGWWVDDVELLDEVRALNNACVTSTEFPTPTCSAVLTIIDDPGCPTITYYADTDGDGFGDPANTLDACTPPAGYVTDNTDCDDGNNTVYPGAPELCDGLDNDCDGVIPTDEIDNDGDGQSECEGDCDDTNDTIYTGAPEICDGLDNDCDGVVPADEIDNDGDGQSECQGDCDDNNDTIYTGAPELCDGLDNDCDGVVPADEIDNDGDGQSECEGDCDDNNDTIYTGAPELCDGLDNDCDGVVPADEIDNDGDGMSECEGDCDDTNDAIYLGAPPTGEGIDNDCNGTVDPDEAAVCAGDFNDSGNVDVVDLLMFLADFGCASGSCIADMTGDGSTSAADLIEFLAVYGTNCP